MGTGHFDRTRIQDMLTGHGDTAWVRWKERWPVGHTGRTLSTYVFMMDIGGRYICVIFVTSWCD